MNYKINLLPPELQEKEIDIKRLGKIFAAVSTAVLVLSCCFYIGWQTFQKQVEVNNQLAALHSEYLEKKQWADAVLETKNKRIKLEQDTKVLENLIGAREIWPQMLADIQECVPTNVKFEKLEIYHQDYQAAEDKEEKEQPEKSFANRPNLLTINGSSITVDDIGRFVYQMHTLQYLAEINVIEIKEDKEPQEQYIYTFIVNAQLKGGGDDGL